MRCLANSRVRYRRVSNFTGLPHQRLCSQRISADSVFNSTSALVLDGERRMLVSHVREAQYPRGFLISNFTSTLVVKIEKWTLY